MDRVDKPSVGRKRGRLVGQVTKARRPGRCFAVLLQQPSGIGNHPSKWAPTKQGQVDVLDFLAGVEEGE